MTYQLICVDQDTLALHINVGAIAAHKNSDQFFSFLDDTYQHGPLVALDAALRAGANRLPLIEFASSYIHELRHYFDLTISSFGNYRIRTALEYYAAIPKLLYLSETIPIPLMSALDPVNRKMMGISEEFTTSEWFRLAKTAGSRVALMSKQNSGSKRSGFNIGGDKIIEALAYLTQFEFLLNDYNSFDLRSYFKEFFSPFTGSDFDLNYRWFIPHVHEIHPGENLPNNRLMINILFSSLNGHIPVRIADRKLTRPLIDTDISQKLPSFRYARLFDYFRSQPRPSLLDDEEAFSTVNQVSRKLFGRSIIEEIDDDLEYTSRLSEVMLQRRSEMPEDVKSIDVYPAIAALFDVRVSLSEALKERPGELISSQGFREVVAQRLKPSLIYNHSGGFSGQKDLSKIRQNWIGLIDRTHVEPNLSEQEQEIGARTATIYSLWSPLPFEGGYVPGPWATTIGDDGLKDETLEAQRQLYGIYAPIYRWLTWGKRYDTMSEFEKYDLVGALGLDQTRFVLDPQFARVKQISSPHLFMRFGGSRRYVCDVCQSPVDQGNSFIVSAITARQNDGLALHYKALGEATYLQWLVRDFSPWLICRPDMERFGLL